jgi:hypothetical protein
MVEVLMTLMKSKGGRPRKDGKLDKKKLGGRVAERK